MTHDYPSHNVLTVCKVAAQISHSVLQKVQFLCSASRKASVLARYVYCVKRFILGAEKSAVQLLVIDYEWTLLLLFTVSCSEGQRKEFIFKDHARIDFPKAKIEDLLLDCGSAKFDTLLLSAGYFPMKLEALPEGSVVHTKVPVFQITTKGKYSPLCTYMEVLLTMVW